MFSIKQIIVKRIASEECNVLFFENGVMESIKNICRGEENGLYNHSPILLEQYSNYSMRYPVDCHTITALCAL